MNYFLRSLFCMSLLFATSTQTFYSNFFSDLYKKINPAALFSLGAAGISGLGIISYRWISSYWKKNAEQKKIDNLTNEFRQSIGIYFESFKSAQTAGADQKIAISPPNEILISGNVGFDTYNYDDLSVKKDGRLFRVVVLPKEVCSNFHTNTAHLTNFARNLGALIALQAQKNLLPCEVMNRVVDDLKGYLKQTKILFADSMKKNEIKSFLRVDLEVSHQEKLNEKHIVSGYLVKDERMCTLVLNKNQNNNFSIEWLEKEEFTDIQAKVLAPIN